MALRSQGALAAYTFQSGYASTDTDLHSTASTFSSSGLTVSSADPSFDTSDTTSVRATAYSMASTASTDYFSFTVTANSGYILNLSGTGALTFQFARGGSFSGNQFKWVVRSSLDSFSANLASGATTTSRAWNTASVNLGTAFDSQSSVTFRIYVFDGGASGNSVYGYLDNVTLNGVSAVPEPANVALAIFGIGVVGTEAIRRLRASRETGMTRV